MSSLWRGSSPSSCSTWLKPMIEFSGVRSSWLIRARNSLLARFALSARALACKQLEPLRSARRCLGDVLDGAERAAGAGGILRARARARCAGAPSSATIRIKLKRGLAAYRLRVGVRHALAIVGMHVGKERLVARRAVRSGRGRRSHTSAPTSSPCPRADPSDHDPNRAIAAPPASVCQRPLALALDPLALADVTRDRRRAPRSRLVCLGSARR